MLAHRVVDTVTERTRRARSIAFEPPGKATGSDGPSVGGVWTPMEKVNGGVPQAHLYRALQAATIRTTADQDSAVAGELAVGEVIAVTDKVPATFGEVVTHSIKFDRGWADVRPFPPLASPPVPHLSWVYPDQFFLWQLVSQTGQPLLEELVLVGLTPLNPIRSASSGYI